VFVHAVFYVGKGKRSRPYEHFKEAVKYFRQTVKRKVCVKFSCSLCYSFCQCYKAWYCMKFNCINFVPLVLGLSDRKMVVLCVRNCNYQVLPFV